MVCLLLLVGCGDSKYSECMKRKEQTYLSQNYSIPYAKAKAKKACQYIKG